MSFTNLVLQRWDGEWPEYIEASHEGTGDLRRYIPERTARLEYDEIHVCNVCTGCGERYEHDKYIALTDDYLIAFKPMRFCPNCGVRFKGDDDGNE